MDEKIICSHCGEIIEGEVYYVNDQPICEDCAESTVVCDCCGRRIWENDDYGDDSISLCHHCYDNHYTRCHECDCLVHNNNVYEYDGYYYCSECYHEIHDDYAIHEYGYKPEPIFYGDGDRYYGVELEIDKGGRDNGYAEQILDVANEHENYIYIKSDGSLDDGMELVSHPMTLDFHKKYRWEEIMKKAIQLGYRSHQTKTCGLHVHVNRNAFGESREEQDEVIARILYFVEHHWNELLKFSRRSEYTMNRWAARYGYENNAKDILDKAKKGNNGRYAAVNLNNYHTIEFRMWRGTLKYSTFIATLQMVDRICHTALYYSEDELKKLSWSEFVRRIDNAPELVQYLKERQLYINDLPTTEEEM